MSRKDDWTFVGSSKLERYSSTDSSMTGMRFLNCLPTLAYLYNYNPFMVFCPTLLRRVWCKGRSFDFYGVREIMYKDARWNCNSSRNYRLLDLPSRAEVDFLMAALSSSTRMVYASFNFATSVNSFANIAFFCASTFALILPSATRMSLVFR